MNKKHPHQILACFFTTLTLFSTVFLIAEAIKNFPLSFGFTSRICTSFAIVIISILFFLGIIFKNKILLVSSSAVLILYKIIISILSGIMDLFTRLPFFSTTVYKANAIVNISGLLTVVTLVFLSLYTLNLMKKKRLIYIFTVITWFFYLSECIYVEFNPLIFFFSAYILLLHYVDIKDQNVPVGMGEIFFLSVVTFGIYYIIWVISLANKTAVLTERKASFSEKVFLIIFPPYSAFWFYSRYENLNEFIPSIKNRGAACMTLSLFLLSPISHCILQRDFNRLVTEAELNIA